MMSQLYIRGRLAPVVSRRRANLCFDNLGEETARRNAIGGMGVIVMKNQVLSFTASPRLII